MATPRLTAKYRTAARLAHTLHLPSWPDQEGLYRALNAAGYVWDSKAQCWEQLSAPTRPATDLIRIRIWAEHDSVTRIAKEISQYCIDAHDWELIECSEPYPCRPPNQLESRIYLTFKPR